MVDIESVQLGGGCGVFVSVVLLCDFHEIVRFCDVGVEAGGFMGAFVAGGADAL